jgi:hypothetical protein
VLYLQSLEDVGRAAAEVSNHMQWIRAHPDSAASLSRRAHAIFSRGYTFEQLLSGVLDYHQSQNQRASAAFNPHPHQEGPAIDVLIFTKSGHVDELRLSLESICNQNYRPIRVLLISEKVTSELEKVADSFSTRVPLSLQVSSERECLSQAVAQTSAAYFAILQPGELWFPNHLRSLLQSLESDAALKFAYSGAVRINGDKPRPVGPFITDPDAAELGYFEPPTDAAPSVPRDLLLPSCILARRELLHDAAQAANSVTSPLSLLFYLIRSGHGQFTYQVTMSYVTRQDRSRLRRAARAYHLRNLVRSKNGSKRLEFATDVRDLTPPMHLRVLRRLQRLLS